MTIRRLINHIFMASACLALLTSCDSYDGEDDGNWVRVSSTYINLSIAVSGGTTYTRAGEEPLGGENGDGREAGFERENDVTGITFILYQGADGINSSDADLDLVCYLPVTRVSKKDEGTTFDKDLTHPNQIESVWETGQQKIGNTSVLDFSKTYHAIVIANANLVTELSGKKLSDVRKKTLSSIYTGSPTVPASNCTNFVMATEMDNDPFTFDSPKTLGGGAWTKGQDVFFDFTDKTIIIERLAARIDFHAANSNGYKTNADNAAYTIPGYEYNVSGSSTDKFVVTGIVPFNLANGHTTFGEEYLIKRVAAKAADLSLGTISYLAEETTNSYVVDPQTLTGKTTDNPYLTNYLSHAIDADLGLYPQLPSSVTSNPYYHSVKDMHDSDAKSTIDSKENVVVAYPMENTLNTTTKPYYYATGVAVVGDYYVNGTGTPTTYVYLSYLRHQGDAATYDIPPYTTPLDKEEIMGATPAMKYGVVRNNIYRISIKSIDQKGSMELSIKVKKWDPYIHEYIYM